MWRVMREPLTLVAATVALAALLLALLVFSAVASLLGESCGEDRAWLVEAWLVLASGAVATAAVLTLVVRWWRVWRAPLPDQVAPVPLWPRLALLGVSLAVGATPVVHATLPHGGCA
ncbi:MAG TPA: hypothetical protein VFI47_09550 [Acidimicrobiales bacterium]|nr:hypothetical protein [Acidimicrobiales bacterium]